MTYFGLMCLQAVAGRTPESREAAFKAAEAWLWAVPGDPGWPVPDYDALPKPPWSLAPDVIENVPPQE